MNRTHATWWGLGVIALLVSGCALPAPEYPEETFVPQREIQVVSLYQEGLYYFSRSRFVDAEFRFRQVLYLMPDMENARLNLAATLANEESYEEAEELFRELLQQNEESSQVLAGLARMYFENGDYARAIEYFDRGLALAEKYKEYERAANFARSLSVLYFKIGDEQQARCYSEYALNLNNAGDALFRHAKLLIGLGLPEQAQELITAAASHRDVKKDPQLLEALGLAQIAQEKYGEALSLIETGIDLKTGDYTLSNTFQLLRFAAKNLQARAEGASAPEDDDEAAEQEIEDEKKLLIDSYDAKPLDDAAALYWPYTLLKYLEERQKELEEE